MSAQSIQATKEYLAKFATSDVHPDDTSSFRMFNPTNNFKRRYECIKALRNKYATWEEYKTACECEGNQSRRIHSVRNQQGIKPYND